MTWQLVTMYPSALKMTPVPTLQPPPGEDDYSYYYYWDDTPAGEEISIARYPAGGETRLSLAGAAGRSALTPGGTDGVGRLPHLQIVADTELRRGQVRRPHLQHRQIHVRGHLHPGNAFGGDGAGTAERWIQQRGYRGHLQRGRVHRHQLPRHHRLMAEMMPLVMVLRRSIPRGLPMA